MVVPQSKLGRVNFLVLQWFGVRLEKVVVSRTDDTCIGWNLLVGVLPLTGWWNHYIPKPKRIRLTNE